jgi:hypothetical protein
MHRYAYVAALGLILGACAQFSNPDEGAPTVERNTSATAAQVIDCMQENAKKHDTPVRRTALPQGGMLDFGDSNIVKVRTDNGQTLYRYYPGKRHLNTMWIEQAGRECAP